MGRRATSMAIAVEQSRRDFQKALIYRSARQIRREIHRHGSPMRTMVLAAPLQDGGQRQRETYDNHVFAVERVLVQLVEHMDLVTLVVGRGHDGEHYGLLVKSVAAKLNMAQRTVERALHTIHALGWIQTKTRAELTEEGRWIGKAAVRFFSAAFFKLIGLARRLERRRAAEYQARKGSRELRDAAVRELRDAGRRFLESRPGRVLKRLGELLRPPDPEPAT